MRWGTAASRRAWIIHHPVAGSVVLGTVFGLGLWALVALRDPRFWTNRLFLVCALVANLGLGGPGFVIWLRHVDKQRRESNGV
jgi:hypothetical protein